MITVTRLTNLYDHYGQSPWLDNIRRSWITDGTLEDYATRGVRGLTSNPTIFQKAITSTTDYDTQFKENISNGLSIETSYWEMVKTDIVEAAQILRGVYETSKRLDGFVSVEVSPNLAYDSASTIVSAHALHKEIPIPNLYVKIPGTTEGLMAIEELIAAKLNINVTLIFGIKRYLEVAESYISGLERATGDLSSVSSVASFFISRIDTIVDQHLEQIGNQEARQLQGKIAISTAKEAYANFQKIYSGPRWDALAARGARPQRLLWASTSTKNPAYSETLYVDELIGPHTVNTMPESTLDAFEHHGTLLPTLQSKLHESQAILASLQKIGIDMNTVADQLEAEGVAAFSESFNGLLDTLDKKAGNL